jgi:hypothetical protein
MATDGFVTDGHGCVLFVVVTMSSFSRSCHITRCLMPLVVQELITFSDQLRSPPFLNGVWCYSICSFLCIVLSVICLFVLLRLTIVLSVLWFTATSFDYSFSIFKLFFGYQSAFPQLVMYQLQRSAVQSSITIWYYKHNQHIIVYVSIKRALWNKTHYTVDSMYFLLSTSLWFLL